MSKSRVLRGLSDIRQHFTRNETPIYYVDATNFHLLGTDEWVRRFQFINYNDCFDGTHPNVFVPPQVRAEAFPFDTLEELNAYLLLRPETQAYVKARGPGKAVFLYFDESVIDACRQLDLEVIFPPMELRQEVDSKIGATRIADRAGVPSVPNVLAHVDSYATLRKVSAPLGNELVIQTPFGDSGVTTFFVANEEQYNKHKKAIERESEVKVMKRIRPMAGAIEACVTRAGTLVGPLMTEIVGFKELTPYQGGWAGNEVDPEAFSDAICNIARDRTVALGDELGRLGYRGYFELDYLIDQDSGELYLGEINPRITGASSMTNLSAFAHADAPLFLFHLLEYDGVDFELDTHELNQRWSDPENGDSWSQLILKYLGDAPVIVARAPLSGVWRMDERGNIHHVRLQTHRRTVDSDNEAFFLRVAAAGDVVGLGYDIGVLVLRGRLMTKDGELTDRAQAWNRAIRAQFAVRDVPKL
jgi:D-alanine-D-alanine ligase-like ATP-grasp enzyme